MADNPNVFITGAADGAFVDALNGLPPWATESTATEIGLILKKILKTQNDTLSHIVKNFKGGSGSDAEKVNDELNKLFKHIRRQNEEAARTHKRQQDEEKDRSKSITEQLFSGKAVTKMFTAIAGIGQKVLSVQKEYFSTSDALFKSGVNLLNGNDATTSSMMSLNQMVSLTGLRLETLQKAIEKNGAAINAVGVTKFAKTLSIANQQLQSYGYNSQEQAELIGTLIESESSYADIRDRSAKDLAADAVRLGAKMTQMSLLTGQSISKMQENLSNLSKTTDSTVVAAVYGKEAAKNLNAFALSFENQNVGQIFQKFGAAQIPELSKTFQDLVTAGEGSLAQEFTRISKYARDTGDALGAQKQATELAQRMDSATLSRLQLFAEAGNEGARAALEFATSVREQGNKTSKATGKQTDAAVDSQSSLSRFSTALEKTSSLAQQAFPLLETQVNLASFALEKFSSILDSITNFFSANTRSWIGFGLAISSLVAGFMANVSTLGTIGTTLLRFAGVLGGIYLAFQAGSAIGTYIYDMIKNLDWVQKSFDVIFGAFDKTVDFILNLPSYIGSKIMSIGDWLVASIKNAFTSIINFHIDIFNGILSKIPGIGKLVPQFERLPTSSATPSRTEVGVTTNPMPTTISSPSAVTTKPETAKQVTAPAPQESTTVAGLGTEKPAKTSDINSILGYQSALLEQLVQHLANLISVNKDILKYAKIT